ncbi:MAG: CorA family divalent cation transporter [Pseudanabaenaceae cyanobacterium]
MEVQGLGSEEVLKKLGKVFNLHPLLLEDVVNVPQRAKVEDYSHQLLLILHMVTPRADGKGFNSEQVSFIIGKNYLLTVQAEPETDVFEPVRQRIYRNRGMSAALLDAIVDAFFLVLENYGERLEALQDEVVEEPTPQTLEKIHRIKIEPLLLGPIIWPQREVISNLIRDESNLLSSQVRLSAGLLRSCCASNGYCGDQELASSLMEVYLSSLNNNINEAMRFLTMFL